MVKAHFKNSVLPLFILLCLTAPCLAAPKNLRSDVLGIRLGMKNTAVYERLNKIGRKERDERKRQEVWILNNDPRFSHVIFGFDPDMKIRYVTALARKDKDARRVRFAEIGDLKRAKEKQTLPNNYQYIWNIASRRAEPKGIVVVRGTDAQYLASLSIKKIVGGED